MLIADTSWTPDAGSTIPTRPVLRIWALALAMYGIGDGLTTALVVWASPLHREANPVVIAAIDAFGGGGLIVLKALAIGVCVGISLWGSIDDDPFVFYLPPITLALVGTATTLLNLNLLL
jgi:hypothetical protein